MSEQSNLTNPFPGLRPFEADEEHLFFGRDGQSDELLRRLRRSRFLAVLGTSGSGKSSLVRAGLLPSLYGGIMTQAGSGWRVALFRPGHDPIGNLAHALNDPQVFGDVDDDADIQRTITEATLRRSALGLVEASRQARMPANENLLVVVDQFEEIFRFKRTSKKDGSEDEAAAFVKLLLEAKRQTNVPIYIVITMRSDFLGDCSQFRDLPEAINEGQYLIPRMTRDERREAITGPVAVGGGEIAPRLMNRLLNDVGDNPDQLPILQHALMRTWDYWIKHRRDHAPLDISDYEAVGTMVDALSRHADEAYNELPDDRSKTIAEKLFKSLTEKGPDNREIRRPTKVKEICAVSEASPAEVISVIERFRQPGRSFLMPPTNTKLGEDSLIDISHESLIRGWERLRKWVNQEARSAQIYRRLAETAALHREGSAGLWHDPDLALALKWRDENRPNAVWAQHYNPDFDGAMSFLMASKDEREAQIAAKEMQRRRETRRTRVFTSVLGVAFLISLGFGVFAFDARTKAYAAANEALEQRNQAVSARKEAEDSRRTAEDSRKTAEEKAREAEVAQKEAETAREKEAEQAEVAKQQAEIAKRRQQEAVVAKTAAVQAQQHAVRQQKRAEKAALESSHAALRENKANRNSMSGFNNLATRLLELSSPQEAAYWRSYKATALTQIGLHQQALDESTISLNTFGDQLGSLTNRGYMYLILQQPENALRDFQRARDLDPQSSLAHVNVGVTAANLKDYDAAVISLGKAIEWYRPLFYDGVFESEISPDIKSVTHRGVIGAEGSAFNVALHYELANVEAFRGSKEFEAKLASADREAEIAKPSVDAYLTALNWAWLQLRKVPEDYGALASQAHLWRKAGYDEWAKYYFLRFKCEDERMKAVALSKKDEALKQLAEAEKKNDPASVKRARDLVASSEAVANRYEGLAKWVDRQLKQLPPNLAEVSCSNPPSTEIDTRTKLLEAEELASRGQTDQAINLLGTAIQEEPENIELVISRARYRTWRGNGEPEGSDRRKAFWESSREDFATALKLTEKYPSFIPNVYTAWAFYGKHMGAIDDNQQKFYFQKAMEMGPADSYVLSQLSDLVAKEDMNKAISLLKRSLTLNPSADTYYKLAKLQNDSRSHQDALESIKMAISLRGESTDYYRERETYYKERERAEEGLGVSETERKRHLAEGYSEIGSSLLKQSKTYQAFQAYKASERVLSEIAKKGENAAVSADLVLAAANLARVREIARTPTVLELISCRILSMEGTGSRRQVVVDRGTRDGVIPGSEGVVWSIYGNVDNKERKVQKIGTARILYVEAQSADVEVVMDDPSGGGLIQIGDMVEFRVKVPVPLIPERSVLWGLSKFHINFYSEDGKRLFGDYRTLYADENEQLVEQELDGMLAEIHKTPEYLKELEVLSTELTEGRFKGKKLKDAMTSATRADLQDFLTY
ncbi:MAG TPA: hypothetical protein VJV03_18560, partial [Pyrinomonadaceae bacterium]|nr:hypothetical protein [Pyrinomonadaceae bacterium]